MLFNFKKMMKLSPVYSTSTRRTIPGSRVFKKWSIKVASHNCSQKANKLDATANHSIASITTLEDCFPE